MGIYNFVDNTIQYFCIIALMGVSSVGIREISKSNGDLDKKQTVFSSLLVLNFATTLLAIFALLVCVFLIPEFGLHKKMFYIGAGRLCANFLSIEWLYKGLEDFKYITYRTLIVRTLNVIAVFIFVRAEGDYEIYFWLNTLTAIVNAAINVTHARKFVRFSISSVNIKGYIKPYFILGGHQILTAMYASLNVTFLGVFCGDTEVGYYSTAVRLYGVIISLYAAFTGVMLPRMSSIVESGNIEEFKRLTRKSLDALMAFSFPLILISVVYAPIIIKIIAGSGYEGAILPMRMVMPLMLVIGYEQILIIQTLNPLRKDKAILINAIIGASVALLLNLTIVKGLASVGSAIVWCCSELAVLTSAQYFVHKYIGTGFPFRAIVSRLALSILLACFAVFINMLPTNEYVLAIFGSIAIFIPYMLSETFLFKNEVVYSMYIKFKELCVKRFQ